MGRDMSHLKAPPGKFRVIGIDKFDGSDWVDRDFDCQLEAQAYAVYRSLEARVSSSSIATVYYAYNDEGKYLDGDIYDHVENEERTIHVILNQYSWYQSDIGVSFATVDNFVDEFWSKSIKVRIVKVRRIPGVEDKYA